MKKIFKYACAAVAATLSFTSCSNEVDMFEKAGKTAKIDLNITNDNAMLTRATQTADNDVWFASVDNATMAAASSIISQSYTTGSHTIKVANFASEANAYDGAGSAYYEGSTTKELTKGTNSVSIDCGKAKNSMVSVDWSGTADVEGLTMTNVVAAQITKSRSYTYTAKGDAFFYAGTDVVCTINYTYNGETKTISKTITAPAAATKYALSIGANSNGTITSLTITYDDTMGTGATTTTTIDAATGAEAQANS